MQSVVGASDVRIWSDILFWSNKAVLIHTFLTLLAIDLSWIVLVNESRLNHW